MPDPRRDGSAAVDTPDLLVTRWSTPTANTIASDIEVKSTSDGRPRYVISTEQLDLQGDIVVQAGLKPVSDRIPAQIDHSGKMRDLIGWWSDIEVRGKKTLATLNLFKPGLSPTADLVRELHEAGGMRMAASIGFVPDYSEGGYELLRDEQNEWVTGFKFLRSLLIEASVVVVPANPGALQTRSLELVKRLGLPGLQPDRVNTFVTSSASQQLLRGMPLYDLRTQAAEVVRQSRALLKGEST